MPDLLIELRTEELPARDLRAAATSLAATLETSLAAAGLAPATCRAAWTPRRIALSATGLAARSPDREERVKGPPESVAFDASGTPTRAALGFAAKCRVGADALERAEGYVHAVVRTPGRDARDVVAEVVAALGAAAPWRKRMRWGAPETFARPVRGLVVLLGADVVAASAFGLAAGRTTQGHRFLAPAPIELADASFDAYREALRRAHVLVDADERRATLRAQVRETEPTADVGDALLEEVANLVEWPTALVGRFDARYLELPPRLLVTVMAHHQRFFPVRTAAGSLEPRFVAVLDRTPASCDVCRPGFERVLVPRLHDASFFLREDRKRRLDERLPALGDVVYHRRLGTLRDKAQRLSALAGRVATLLGHDAAGVAAAERAGLLAKCDLVTLMVGEFPELQGHVGSVYAAADGEAPEVAEALDWQYRHDLEGVRAPSPCALALLLAENLDVLCQFGARVGLPTGSADPFGVRRAALTFLDASERFAPDLVLADALAAGGGDDAVAEYLRTRLVRRLRDRGVAPDRLDATAGAASVGELLRRLEDLDALAATPHFARLLEVAERCRNITRASDAPAVAVREELLREDAEHALQRAWSAVRATLPPPPARLSRAEAERVAAAVAEPLHTYFEQVFVNADDADLRANRHALLREIDAALLRFADLCKLTRHPA